MLNGSGEGWVNGQTTIRHLSVNHHQVSDTPWVSITPVNLLIKTLQFMYILLLVLLFLLLLKNNNEKMA